MKILGVIPARYNSTRYPGKPLALILGKPMLYWIYHEAKKSLYLDEVIIATEDLRVVEMCEKLNIGVMITSNQHTTPLSRLYEVAETLKNDQYVFIGVDEPLLTVDIIDTFIEQVINEKDGFIYHAMTSIHSEEDIIDHSNIKLEISPKGFLLNTFRDVRLNMHNCGYMKFVGLGIFTRDSLGFFYHTKPSKHEKMEKCDLLRFIENNNSVKMIDIHNETISVDTIADRDRVEKILIERRGEV